MTHCSACHRPVKHQRPSGMGPVCEKRAAPLPEIDRDLFGYDVPAACTVARERVRIHIKCLAIDALMATRHDFAAARRRLGVWS